MSNNKHSSDCAFYESGHCTCGLFDRILGEEKSPCFLPPLILIVILLILSILFACGSSTPIQLKPSLPFDATLYRNKPMIIPDMDGTLLLPSGNFGFSLYVPRLAHLGGVEGMWDDPVKLATVAKAAWKAGYTKFCMDDEGGDNLRIRNNIAVIRKAAPGMKVGVFCFPQIYFNWSPEHTREVNDAPEVRSILNACDFAVPGLDLRWDMGTAEGRAAWLALLRVASAEAKRTMPGKPCYPFVPFEYNPVLKTGELTTEEMAWQLRQVQALGLQPILWGGFQKDWGDYPWRRGLKRVFA